MISSVPCDLRCADVHAIRCDVVLHGSSPDESVSLARQHGTNVHGFTSAFYSEDRVATMFGAVNQRHV